MSAIRNVNKGIAASAGIANAIAAGQRLPLPLHLLPYPTGGLAGHALVTEAGG